MRTLAKSLCVRWPSVNARAGQILCVPTVVEKIGMGGAKTKLRVQIDEGKNRHIRRLFGGLKDEKFGTPLKVLELCRVSIGSFKLDIEISSWRCLSLEEEKMLLKNLK